MTEGSGTGHGALAVVPGVNTLPPGNPANMSLSVVGNTLHFTFDIPQGETGPMGEVINADVNSAISNAISGTSNNTNGVSNLGQSADFNCNHTRMQDVPNKLDDLINAARR